MIKLDEVYYSSCEHAYQAAKTIFPDERKLFTALGFTAGDAKKLGQTLKLREDWDHIKVNIMEDLVRQKFQTIVLRAQLLKTGQAIIIEGNSWHDQFWGDCTCLKHQGIPGQNHLGRILMKIRGECNVLAASY
jgi:ribA/ribD-fused uncharacterized protein